LKPDEVSYELHALIALSPAERISRPMW